jgi:CheY-like chemotaxis protein
MGKEVQDFGNAATSLARNPLGIIALFIVLVYGLAAMVAAFASSLTAQERVPLIYFLVIFPVLVLAVFAWLVSKHSGKLFAPSDFKDEANYVRMQLSAVASLTAATVSREGGAEVPIGTVVDAVQSAAVSSRARRSEHIPFLLWVDDNPSNNTYEANAFEAVGIKIERALSTQEALQLMQDHSYDAIISDMGRREGPREGYVLLDAIRGRGDDTPYFIYAGSNLPEHDREARQRGAQGSTNDAEDLFKMVVRAVFGSRNQ